jgi:hypothetical protein
MAVSKFFTTEIKPAFTDVAQIIASNKADAAFSAGDVLFDWQEMQMPRGAAKLKDINVMLRGTHTAGAMQFFFAKPNSDGTAPSSIGTPNATANGTGYYDNVLGAVVIDDTAVKNRLDFMDVYSMGAGASGDQMAAIVVESAAEYGQNVGYDKVYVACVGHQNFALNFSTNVVTAGAHTDDATNDITVTAAADPRHFFQKGDVLHIHDVNTAIGTVSSLPDATSIILTSNNVGAIASADEIVNLSPIKCIFSWEK